MYLRNSRRSCAAVHTCCASCAKPSFCKLCRREKHDVRLQVKRVQLSEAAATQWGVSHAWEHRIKLVTGRTHQIRAQLAAVAAPVLGDLLYTALLEHGIFQAVPSRSPCLSDDAQPSLASGQVPLTASAQGQPATSPATTAGAPGLDAETGTDEGMRGDGEVPKWVEEYRVNVRQEAPLGLQAHELQVHSVACMGPPPVVYSAGCPWWRTSGPADTPGVACEQ